MHIYIRLANRSQVKLDVTAGDTISSIKSRLYDNAGVREDHQVLLYAGKEIRDAGTLSRYNIQDGATMDCILRAPELPRASIIPTASGLSHEGASRAKLQAWKALAEYGHFDDDVCIVDPQSHYDEMSRLETGVVEASEFFHHNGTYGSAFATSVRPLTLQQKRLHHVPERMWQLLKETPAGVLEHNSNHPLESLASLQTSYLIFCRVLSSFDILNQAGFCTTYYSILLEQSNRPVAQIIKIPREVLETIKTGVETAVNRIVFSELHPEGVLGHLRECVEDPCTQLLNILDLPTPLSRRSASSILALCRTLALVADLGLVSYAGSHATRFDLDYLEKDLPKITIHDGNTDSLYFECQLRQLACLRGFLDEEDVWVFRCSPSEPKDFSHKDTQTARLFILARIEEFSDIWGPVWSIPVENSSGLIQHHNVSKGVICRVDETNPPIGDPVRCHWYDWASFRRRYANPLLSSSKPLLLDKDDLLLIGTSLRPNYGCKYTINQFEADYGHNKGILGTERSFWEPGLDSRTGGFSLPKIGTFSVSGTQKKRPQTTLKQLTLGKWKTAPERANPGILNQYLGVEISHCTGHARRVRLKDLLLMRAICPMLELHFPGWSSLQWGSDFRKALESDDAEAIFNVWIKWESKRSDIAALVCWVLETLDMTGRREDGLVAAFLNNRQESSITLDYSRNDWASVLRDSHLMASYVVINSICLEYHTPDHSTAMCDNDLAYTILETCIGLGPRQDDQLPDLLKILPHHQVFKLLQKVGTRTLLLTPGSSASTASAYLRSSLSNNSVALAVELRDATTKYREQYKAFLHSSSKSHGGMKTARKRYQREQVKPVLSPLQSQPRDSQQLVPRRRVVIRPVSTKIPPLSPDTSQQQTSINPALLIFPASDRISSLDLQNRTLSTQSQQTRQLRSNSVTVLRRVQPDTNSTRTSDANFSKEESTSLMHDIKNFQVNDYEDPSDPDNLLHDLDNHRIDFGQIYEPRSSTTEQSRTSGTRSSTVRRTQPSITNDSVSSSQSPGTPIHVTRSSESNTESIASRPYSNLLDPPRSTARTTSTPRRSEREHSNSLLSWLDRHGF